MRDRRNLLKAVGLGAVGLASGYGPAVARPAAIVAQDEPADETLRQALRDVMGAMPTRPEPRFRVLESEPLRGGRRDKIEYLAEPGDPLLRTPDDFVRAYLFVPDLPEGDRAPAVVAIHQDGPQSHIGKAEPAGLAGDPTMFYGLQLFQRGYVVICPDRFPHAERRRVQPNDLTSIDPDRDDNLFDHRAGQLVMRGRTALGKEAYDLMVAVDILLSLTSVDPDRIGWFGHSAGGLVGVLFMFVDDRVKAGVSSCGLFGFGEFYREDAPKRRAAAIALPGLLNVGDSGDFLALIGPRPVMLTRGLWEWGRDERWAPFSKRHVADTLEMERRARRIHGDGPGSTLKVIYFDEEGGGHALPADVRRQAFSWLDSQLGHVRP